MNPKMAEVLERSLVIENEVATFLESGKKLFVSSSFQTHSIPLLHMVTRVSPGIPFVFVDTGYHFPETIAFVRQVKDQFNLNLFHATSDRPKIEQLDTENRLLFATNPDMCCQINKVDPLREYLSTHDIWVSGLRADQSESRSRLSRLEDGPLGVKKYLPLLDWTREDVEAYRHHFDLPAHPLDPDGVLSVGCEPCTEIGPVGLGIPTVRGAPARANRWLGMEKTECGLHLQSAFESVGAKR